MHAQKFALNRLSALTAGGTLLFGITLWTASFSQSIDKPDTPLKVALVLDCITQPRFQADLLRFGLERMVPVAGGHLTAGQLVLTTQKDRDLFKTAENSHRDFVIGFIHCAHVVGKRAGSVSVQGGFGGAIVREKSVGKAEPGQPPVDASLTDTGLPVFPICNHLRHLYAVQGKAAPTETANLMKEMGTAAQKAMPKLMQGKGVEKESGDWLVVTRPVRALKASCLKCHEGTKLGDTLGVLAYAVSKRTFADALPATGDRPVGGLRGGF